MKKLIFSALVMMFFSLTGQAHVHSLFACENWQQIADDAQTLKHQAVQFRHAVKSEDANFRLGLKGARLALAAAELEEEANEKHGCLRLKLEFRDVREAFQELSSLMGRAEGADSMLVSSSYADLECTFRALEAEVEL